MEAQNDYDVIGAAQNYQFAPDSNQEKAFMRILRQTLVENPDMMIDEAAALAAEAVTSFTPTANEAAQRIAEIRSGPAYCYLAFYGLSGKASYMKVGMSRHPERRLYNIATGNPLDCLWVFVARFPVASKAFAAEKAILRHLKSRKRRGEWIDVGETYRESAERLADQLALVCESPEKGFILLGAGHGS